MLITLPVTVLLVFCLISAFTTYTLGIFVFARKPSSSVHQLFLVLMLASACWAGGEFLIWQSQTPAEFALWLRACSFWPFVIALAVHFILTLAGHPLADRKHRPIIFALLYIPATLITVAELLTDAIYIVSFVPGTGLVYIPAPGSPAFLVETLFNLVIMLFATYISVSSWLHAPPGRVRRQYGLVSAGIVAVIGCGLLSAMVLPAAGIFLPNLVFLGLVIFSLLISFAILRYGLFTVTPETALPDILRLIPDGVILSGMDGRIITANTAAAGVLGVAESTLSGRNIGSFIPEPVCSTLLSSIRDRGSLPDIEAVLDGDRQRVVSIAGAEVKDPEGEPAGLVLIVRDITGRKEAERALLIAHEKVSLLTRLTRHDIGNIVTALWGYLELLKENRSGPASDEYIAQSIGLVEKISDHLRFSREMQDACSYTPAWQPLAPMVDQAVRELPHEGVAITTGIAPVEVLADPMAVRVIYNILENAVRHGGRLTEVSITTAEQSGGGLLLTVEDDGSGVREEDKEQIFVDGFGKNTGLGLALSRDILSLTGITIKETGTAGEGARFELLVPKGGWRVIPGGN